MLQLVVIFITKGGIFEAFCGELDHLLPTRQSSMKPPVPNVVVCVLSLNFLLQQQHTFTLSNTK
jgi:hypothetical protein